MPKRYTISGIAVMIAAIIAWTWYMGTVDGSSVESRRELLSQKVVGAHVAAEFKGEGYIISGFTSDAGENGLAVFTHKGGGKYKLGDIFTEEKDSPVKASAKIDGENYDLFWLNSVDAASAQVTYSYGGKKDILDFDFKESSIICNPSPKGSYSVNVIWYDAKGNECR